MFFSGIAFAPDDIIADMSAEVNTLNRLAWLLSFQLVEVMCH